MWTDAPSASAFALLWLIAVTIGFAVVARPLTLIAVSYTHLTLPTSDLV